MAENPLLKELKEGDPFLGHLLALEAAFKVSARGSEYLELRLGDASGDLKAFLWDVRAIEGEMDLIRPDSFLKVKGTATSFNGRLQLKLDKVRFAPDDEVGDLSRFFPTSARPVEDMLEELDGLIRSIRDPWLRPLLAALLQEDPDLRQAFARAPAAKSLHHVFLGGLLEHTLSVAAAAEHLCAHYRSLNRDLLMTGVLLHDLGKTLELRFERSFGYTDEGNLLGHIFMETERVRQAMEAVPSFPVELRLQLTHLLLSHHGRLEFGSPVLPRTPEALVLHYLDDLDGKLDTMLRTISEDTGETSWTPTIRSLERPAYKPRWPVSVDPVTAGL